MSDKTTEAITAVFGTSIGEKVLDMAITSMVGVVIKKVPFKQKVEILKMMCDKLEIPLPFNMHLPEDKSDAG